MFHFQRFISQDFYLSRMNPGGADGVPKEEREAIRLIEEIKKDALYRDLIKAFLREGRNPGPNFNPEDNINEADKRIKANQEALRRGGFEIPGLEDKSRESSADLEVLYQKQLKEIEAQQATLSNNVQPDQTYVSLSLVRDGQGVYNESPYNDQQIEGVANRYVAAPSMSRGSGSNAAGTPGSPDNSQFPNQNRDYQGLPVGSEGVGGIQGQYTAPTASQSGEYVGIPTDPGDGNRSRTDTTNVPPEPLSESALITKQLRKKYEGLLAEAKSETNQRTKLNKQKEAYDVGIQYYEQRKLEVQGNGSEINRMNNRIEQFKDDIVRVNQRIGELVPLPQFIATTAAQDKVNEKLKKYLLKEAEKTCKQNGVGYESKSFFGIKKFNENEIKEAVKKFEGEFPQDPNFLRRAQILAPNFIQSVTAQYFSNEAGKEAAKETIEKMQGSVQFVLDVKGIVGDIKGLNRPLNKSIDPDDREGFKQFAQNFKEYDTEKPFPITAITNPKNKELVKLCAKEPAISAEAMQAFRIEGQESGLNSFKPIHLKTGVELSIKAANTDPNRTPEEKKLAAKNIAHLIGSDAVDKKVNGSLNKGIFSRKAKVSKDKLEAIERGVNNEKATPKPFTDKMNKNFGLGGAAKDKKALNFNPIDNFKATFRFIDGKNAEGKPISRLGALAMFPFRAAKLVVSVVVATPIALIRTAIQNRAEKKNSRLEDAANYATKYPKVYAAIKQSLSNDGKEKVTNKDLNKAFEVLGSKANTLEQSTLTQSKIEASFNVKSMRTDTSKETHTALQNLIKSHEKKEEYKGRINTLILNAENNPKTTPPTPVNKTLAALPPQHLTASLAQAQAPNLSRVRSRPEPFPTGGVVPSQATPVVNQAAQGVEIVGGRF
jgi:hypothetical protein